MTASLRRRLGLGVVGIAIASWLAVAALGALALRAQVQRETDRVLAAVLAAAETVGRSIADDPTRGLREALAPQLEALPGSPAPQHATRANPVVARLKQTAHAGSTETPALNIWGGNHHILVGDDTPRFADPSALAPGTAAVDQRLAGLTWRVLYRRDARTGLWYAAGLPQGRLLPDALNLATPLLWPLALVVPLTLLALYAGIARGLQPLARIAAEIARRRAPAALEPLATEPVPAELRPVVESLNHLLARLAATLENEQRFTANAAHELQTPLAAISAEVQLCARLLDDDEGRRMMERIRARVDRAAHTVRQLLVLARLDPQRSIASEDLPLAPLAEEVLAELGHLASERGLRVEVDIAPDARLRGDRETVLILLRNLVGNAFRHARHGGSVRVQAAGRRLRIANDAEPIAQPERLTGRFERGEGAAAGAGLGLSIVQRICELLDCRLALAYEVATGMFVATVDRPA